MADRRTFLFALPAFAALSVHSRAAGIYRHISVDDRISDLLLHPAFAGFAASILPGGSGAYDQNMRLRGIGSLLPYHTHVNPEVVVAALNRMVDDAASGKQVFYDIYSETERRQQAAYAGTGLFFVRGTPGAPFAVIAPGGGFSYVGSVHEGFPYALELSKKGYNAFVLRYRVGQGGAAATEDLAAAISYVLRNAETLRVSPRGYSLWGSSAGARMAAAIGTHGVARFGGAEVSKPAVVVTLYTGHSEYSSADPPTFVVVGESDRIAPPAAMERRVADLRRAGVEVEYHKIAGVGHGFGLGTGTNAEGWIDNAVRFWRTHENLK